jgi:hypothetical protein
MGDYRPQVLRSQLEQKAWRPDQKGTETTMPLACSNTNSSTGSMKMINRSMMIQMRQTYHAEDLRGGRLTISNLSSLMAFPCTFQGAERATSSAEPFCLGFPCGGRHLQYWKGIVRTLRNKLEISNGIARLATGGTTDTRQSG